MILLSVIVANRLLADDGYERIYPVRRKNFNETKGKDINNVISNFRYGVCLVVVCRSNGLSNGLWCRKIRRPLGHEDHWPAGGKGRNQWGYCEGCSSRGNKVKGNGRADVI